MKDFDIDKSEIRYRVLPENGSQLVFMKPSVVKSSTLNYNNNIPFFCFLCILSLRSLMRN